MADEEQIILPAGYIKLKYLENKVTSTGQKNAHTSVPLSFDFKLDGTGDSELIIETVHAINDVSVNDQAEGTIAGPNATSSNSDEFYWLIWDKYVATHSCAWLNPNFYPKNNEYFKVILKWTPQTSSIDVIDSDGTSYYAEKPSNSNWRCENMGIFHKLIELSGSAAYKSLSGKKKYWKAWKNGELIYNLIPCLDRNYEPCFYDTISGQSFYNTNSSGSFTYQIDDKQLGILHKLPEGFTKVNYLIANGSQYIDTNYIPTNETGYYLEGQGYTTSETYYFGTRNESSTDTRIYFCATPNVNWGWMTYGTLTNAAANLRQETTVYHNFLNSRKSVATINETNFTYNLPELNFVPTRELMLFNFNNGGVPHASYGLKGRIDTFLISEGEQIVRQFVPCLDADGIPCMYELYTGTAHYNQGAGQFSYPRKYTNDPINLPAGYTKCVYLQSNGTQWIDTEVIPTDDTGVYIKAQHLSYGDHPPIGSWESANNYYYPPRFNLTNKSGSYSFGTTYQSSFYYDKGDDLVFTSTMNLYNDRTVNFWSEDTNWFGIIPVNFTATFTRPLWLFSYNMNNSSIDVTYGKFGGRIFRAKITQGDYLVHDFVPCLDADNRPCMYDLVTQEPYYNQSGGAEFAYCVEHQLPSDFIKLKYLESTGTQIIKTGYVPTDSTGIYIDAYHTKHNGNTNGSVIGLRNTNGNTYFFAPRVQRDTNGAGFGWGAFTTPGGNGNVRYEATLNFLNDRKAIITAPAFAQRINALGTLSFAPTKDLYMFGMNNYDGAATLYSTYRIYRAKISEGSEVVRDWVPAMDNRNSKPCMYDLINNVAYYNDGTGEFIYNRDFEGTYKGFALLSGIGNRLGYGEPFRGNENNEGDEYLLLSSDEDWMNQQFVDTGFSSEDVKDETVGSIRAIFERTLDEDYNAGYYNVYIPLLNSGELPGLSIDDSSGIWSTEDGDVYCTKSCDTTGTFYAGACHFYSEDQIEDVTLDFHNETATCNGVSTSLEDAFGYLYWGHVNNFLVFSWPKTTTKIYECFFYDTEGNEISHMIPHEENGQKGLYCTIRNIFLPVQLYQYL